jgi:selenocysteine lyase/cysteine desulfurase
MVRVGAVHYDTLEEIEWFGEALGRIATNVV